MKVAGEGTGGGFCEGGEGGGLGWGGVRIRGYGHERYQIGDFRYHLWVINVGQQIVFPEQHKVSLHEG